MAARHGTRRRYNEGCRCEDCTAANAAYQQRYGQRPLTGVANATPAPYGPAGPVESGVEAEIAGHAEARPGLTQAAFALARLLDNQRAVSTMWPQRRCWPRCWTRWLRRQRVVGPAAWRWCGRCPLKSWPPDAPR